MFHAFVPNRTQINVGKKILDYCNSTWVTSAGKLWILSERGMYDNGNLIMFMYNDSKGLWGQHGPTWGRQDLGGPHVGPMNLAIGVKIK